MTQANGTYYLVGSDGSTIAFDDIRYGILREDLEGLSGYPVDYETTQAPGNVGTSVINTVIGEREISLQVMVFGEGRAQLEERRRALIRALNPMLGPCRLYWHQENGETLFIECRPDDGCPAFEEGTAHSARMWQCTVDLICHNPCWQSRGETVYTLITDAVGFHLPFQIPFTLGVLSPYIDVVNNGSAKVPVLIELKGPMEAPISLQNLTAGQEITVKKDVLAGDTLKINTDRNDLRVTYTDHTTGAETNALYYCTTGSKFWQLAVGLNELHVNIFNIGTGAEATLKFREQQVSL